MLHFKDVEPVVGDLHREDRMANDGSCKRRVISGHILQAMFHSYEEHKQILKNLCKTKFCLEVDS